MIADQSSDVGPAQVTTKNRSGIQAATWGIIPEWWSVRSHVDVAGGVATVQVHGAYQLAGPNPGGASRPIGLEVRLAPAPGYGGILRATGSLAFDFPPGVNYVEADATLTADVGDANPNDLLVAMGTERDPAHPPNPYVWAQNVHLLR